MATKFIIIVILLDYAILQQPNITASGQNSVLFQLDAYNASYSVTIVDLSNGSIVTNLTVFGNSNAYKVELADPDPCHLYNVSMELNYHEKCTSGIATYSLATFEASESEYHLACINYSWIHYVVPFKVEKDSIVVNLSDDLLINVSFKVQINHCYIMVHHVLKCNLSIIIVGEKFNHMFWKKSKFVFV